MEHVDIVLTDNQIEMLINGEIIEMQTGKDQVITIRESYRKSAGLNAREYPLKVVDTSANKVMNKHFAHHLLQNEFEAETQRRIYGGRLNG